MAWYRRALCFTFPSTDLIQNIQRYYETRSVFLPVHTVSVAVKSNLQITGVEILGLIRILIPFF
jgi:hypothetical protein